jgi:hypothetical protein
VWAGQIRVGARPNIGRRIRDGEAVAASTFLLGDGQAWIIHPFGSAMLERSHGAPATHQQQGA